MSTFATVLLSACLSRSLCPTVLRKTMGSRCVWRWRFWVLGSASRMAVGRPLGSQAGRRRPQRPGPHLQDMTGAHTEECASPLGRSCEATTFITGPVVESRVAQVTYRHRAGAGACHG